MNLIFLYFFLSISAYFPDKYDHPYHVGVVEIEYHRENKELQISGKWFVDDLEEAIYKRYKVKRDLIKNVSEISKDTVLLHYFNSNLTLSQYNKKLKLDCVGAEHENGAVWLYFLVKNFNAEEYLTCNNLVLCDLHKGQSHIIHFLGLNKRESFKSNCSHPTLKYKW